MAYDLHDLLIQNDEVRRYFMKLPVSVQLTAHRENNRLKTEAQLRQYIAQMTKRNPDGC